MEDAVKGLVRVMCMKVLFLVLFYPLKGFVARATASETVHWYLFSQMEYPLWLLVILSIDSVLIDYNRYLSIKIDISPTIPVARQKSMVFDIDQTIYIR